MLRSVIVSAQITRWCSVLARGCLAGCLAGCRPPASPPASPGEGEASTIALGSVEADPRATCLACHGDQEVAAAPPGSPFDPVLPSAFVTEWYYYNVRSDTPPPYDRTPDAAVKGHGYTYYDWSKRAMVEVYEDVCVNRFPSGHQFPCKFIHVGEVAYFVEHRRGIREPPNSCCVVLEPPFFPTPPNFVSLEMRYQKSMPLDHKDAHWWLLDVHYPSRYFGFGIYTETGEPAAFWYRVLDGWGQQTYYNFRRESPDDSVFDIPALCREAALCNAVRAEG